MKLSEIIKQVNRDVDESYSNADITEWINRGLDDLTPIAKKQAKTTYTITSANSYALPSDLHKVDFVLVKTDATTEYDPLSQRDTESTGYKMWGGNLSLQNGPTGGSIDLYYYKRLKQLTTTNIDEEPEIEKEYHDLLIFFAIGNMQFKEEDYDDRPDMLQRYALRKAEYEKFINDKLADELGDQVIREAW